MIKFFKDDKNILAVMSERKDGSMKLLGSQLNDANRTKFFKKYKIEKEKIISAKLTHTSIARVVNKKSPAVVFGADALITKDRIFLALTTADCVPVYFYDEKNKIIGLAHAGWRGVAGKIVRNTLEKMSKLGAEKKAIRIALGPGIKKCHFEIKKDIVDEFKNYSQFVIKKNGKIFVDLFGIIKEQLISLKIEEENIFISSECTYENKKRYFSYRRDKPVRAEVMMAIIGMR
jgi:polyphenol oxidase